MVPGGQREICGGGGVWQTDNDGMDIGGGATSTPAAETGAAAGGGGGGVGPGGQQEIGGDGGGGDGGAAEEMDRDGADDGGGEPLPKPDGYAQMTKTQQRNWRKNRAKKNH